MIQICEQAIDAQPRFAPLLMLRGRVHSAMESYHDAIIDFTQAMKLDRTDPMPLIQRGYCKLRSKVGDLGMSDFNTARKLNRWIVQPVVLKAAVLLTMKDYEKALKCLNRAIGLQPLNVDHFVNRAVVLVMLPVCFSQCTDDNVDIFTKI